MVTQAKTYRLNGLPADQPTGPAKYSFCAFREGGSALSRPDHNYHGGQHDKHIVCLSSTRWDFLWQRPQQLMSRLSRTYNILYVNPPFPAARQEVQQLLASKGTGNISKRLTSVSRSLQVFQPLQMSETRTRDIDQQILAEMNAQTLRDQLISVLLWMRWQRPLLWIYDPQACMIADQIRGRGVVYDCVDSFHSFSWANPRTIHWERELAAKADVVLTSALALYQSRAQHNDATYLVPNAVDYDFFSRAGSIAGEPREIAELSRPILGFIGAVYEWMDLGLLDAVAEARTDWNIVLIGPKQHGLELPDRPNIHWLGPRDYITLPWYIQSFPLMLIPFLHNEITEHANPIKMWEYLAAGKPIVATLLPEIPDLPGVIWRCKEPDQFIANCDQVLELVQDREQQRNIAAQAQATAKANSWDVRCQQIRQILKTHFGI